MDDVSTQNSQVKKVILLLVVVAGGGGWYWQQRAKHQEPAAVSPVSVAAAVPAEPVAQIRYPLVGPTEDAAPATVATADPDLATALGSLFGPEMAAWLIPDKLLRRLVATTDNLSRNMRTEQLRPLRAPAGALAVQREVTDATIGAERITLGTQNAARYDVPVSLLSKADMQQAAALYRQLYPQLQRAYEDLGYPDGYFNDRVIDTIDHLLATPEPAGALLLEQPKVLYRFADPDLEARSAGQKTAAAHGGGAHARDQTEAAGIPRADFKQGVGECRFFPSSFWA